MAFIYLQELCEIHCILFAYMTSVQVKQNKNVKVYVHRKSAIFVTKNCLKILDNILPSAMHSGTTLVPALGVVKLNVHDVLRLVSYTFNLTCAICCRNNDRSIIHDQSWLFHLKQLCTTKFREILPRLSGLQ